MAESTAEAAIGGEATTAEKVGVIVIHGVGDTETGWINSAIVEPVAADAGLVVSAHSEVHSLPETGGEQKDAHFNALVRRADHGQRSITFAEFVWADLSRLGRGPLTLTLEALKVSLEAPDVLARAFLRNRQRGIHWLIGLFVLTSSRLLKWFVIGLNVAVITFALWFASLLWIWKGFGYAQVMPDRLAIAWWLLPPILLFLIGGSLLFYWRQKRDIGVSDFGLGCAISAIVVLVYLVIDHTVAIGATSWPIVSEVFKDGKYFDNGRLIVFGFWALWCITTTIAIVLLVLVWLVRALGWRPSRPVPLVAAWVGMFNILMQAIVVKLVMTPLSIVSCMQLNDAVQKAAGMMDASRNPPVPLEVCNQFQSTGVLAFTLFETVFLVVALAWIHFLRKYKARKAGARAEDVPRFIVHPLLVVVAVLTVGMHICVFAGEMVLVYARLAGHGVATPAWLTGLGDGLPVALREGIDWIVSWPRQGYRVLGQRFEQALILLMPIYLSAMNFVLNSSSPVIHIARDLIDHQYRARRSLARLWGNVRAGTRAAASAPARPPSHPRRARIAGRLDTIMKRLLAKEKLDKLIFVAHSQGSVIAFDFLRAGDLCPELAEVGEIHVVTLGSPLSHIYGHYFDEYERPVEASVLPGNVRSWTNMWRIDDPIGNEVKVVQGALIVNRTLGLGGHVNYWTEPKVRRLIADLIKSPVTRRFTPAAPSA